MSADGLSRGVPDQHLPENQDADVQFNLDEVTGEITPLESAEPKAKGKKRAATTQAAGPTPGVEKEDVDAAGEGE